MFVRVLSLSDVVLQPRRLIGFTLPLRESAHRQESVKESVAATHHYFALQSAESVLSEAARIVALLLEGKAASAIVTEPTGVTSKHGKPYLTTLAEVLAAIRDTRKQRLQAA